MCGHSIEINHLKVCLKQSDRIYFTERCKLIEECNKFMKVVSEGSWGAAVKVVVCCEELHPIEDKISKLKYAIASSKVVKEAWWGSATKISQLQGELCLAQGMINDLNQSINKERSIVVELQGELASA